MTKEKAPKGKAVFKEANGAWHSLIALDGKIVCVFKVAPTLKQGKAMAEAISYTVEDPRDRDLERREHVADCAWFLMRFLGDIVHMGNDQLRHQLVIMTRADIEQTAFEVQDSYFKARADLIQSVLVGDPAP